VSTKAGIRSALIACAAILTLGGCATSTQLNAQWVNPEAGARLPLRNMVVMGINRDTTARRIYEDAMVAELSARGVQALASYKVLPDEGPASEQAIQKAVTDAGADAILVSRTVSVSDEVRVSPGMVMGPPFGFGWRGFYGYYHGMWSAAYYVPPTVYTVRNVLVDTRLFDAREQAVIWSGSSTTTPTGTMQQTINQFAATIAEALARDKVISAAR
jgi:hypothetical protein